MKSLKTVVVKTTSQRTQTFQRARTASAAIPKLIFALASVLLFSLSTNIEAASLPTGFSETQVAGGLLSPVAMEFAPDGRLFVSEQTGRVRVIKNGVLLSTPFVDLSSQVDSAGERGLFGIAFDPNFSSNHFVYIYYTAKSPASHNRVSRFTASGDVVVAGSEVVIFELNNLNTSTFHNGGAIHFAPDGKLFIATGEANIAANADSFQNLLGKILRINSDGTIPADNPFYNTTSGNNRAIWALGLRNPYTFALQPGTGRIFINDVGENTWEEINDGIAGSHYGWPNTEGPTANASYRSPLYAYQHGTGPVSGCAITGGAFYNPPVAQFPSALVGNYFFADYCGGWINRIDPANPAPSVTTFATGISSPVDLKVGAEGSLYYLARGTGSNTGGVYKITNDAGTPPPAIDEVYLSDLQWVSATNGWGPVERDQSNGEQGSGDGHIITLNGTTYAKGLGVHAPSEIIYNLGGNYSTFLADVGIDDEVTFNGLVTFEVWADGVKLYDSGPIVGGSATEGVVLNVAGRQQLRLVVTDGGDGIQADHADWAGARLTKSAGQAPVITAQPVSQTVSPNQTVTFSVTATGPSPLSYQWQRNGANLIGQTSSTYTVAATPEINGARFRVVVTNSFGSIVSNEAVLTISANQSPTATIVTPAVSTLYSGGDTINFSGTATDAEDGQLPASAFTWRVDFQHDTHTHPFINSINGVRSGSFQIPTVGEVSANVWYRIYLTVTDSSGATYTTFRDVFPRKSRMTFLTSPPGLQITVDGQPRTTPITIEGVVGITRTLGVVSPQAGSDGSYNFSSWSDGGAATHTISTPASDTTYTAFYTLPGGLSDDFNDNTRDPKWQLGALNEPNAFDAQVGVFERNQRLEIVPRAGISGSHFNGYVSGFWNIINVNASVEVVQTAINGADTVFAVGTDSDNWYRFVVENGQLYFQDKIGGVKNSTSITYSAAQYRFWRFHYDGTNDAIVFETSSDGLAWVARRSVPRRIQNMRVELDAGTFAPANAPGTAIFDNFKLESITAPPPASVGLSASFYTVNEADPSGAATITVSRSGDVQSALSVDYATSDLSGVTPCQTNQNGNASERCDYATSAGTLRFAAGEVSKTISIPIINDAYVEPAETFNISLRNVQGATLAGTSTAVVTIVSDDNQLATQNPIDEQGFFIKQQYIDFLGRVAEQAGFDFWNGRMNNCPSGQTCDRIDTSLRFFQSDEFQERGFYVYRLYDAVLGRLPKYAEFVPDVARLNGSQTVTEQRQSKDAYLSDFINKQEFKTLYGQYLSANLLTASNPAGFVDAMCQKAGITPASRQSLINNLQTGARTPAQTLEDFILQPELSNVGTKFYDRGFIAMQYFGYLRRDPDAGGFNFWVGQLIGTNAPHKQDYRFMVGGFINSDEYHFRYAMLPAR